MTDLNSGALFNAEFEIRHRGSTVPERSGVELSFCRRRAYGCWLRYHCSAASSVAAAEQLERRTVGFIILPLACEAGRFR
jgi:hypothetical protein